MGMNCVICRKDLVGLQRKFCSRNCRRTDWKNRNPDKQRSYVNKSVTNRMTARREMLRSLKDKPCADCGISYPYYVMEFDHVRGVKKHHLSLVNSFTDEQFLAEIDKCEVVCANCHRYRTYRTHWVKSLG